MYTVRTHPLFKADYEARNYGYGGTWDGYGPGGWYAMRVYSINVPMVNGREFNPASSATPDVPSDRPLRLGKHPSYGLMLDMIPTGGGLQSADFAWHDFKAINNDSRWTVANWCNNGLWFCGYGGGYYMSFTLPISYEDGGAALLSVKHGAPRYSLWNTETKNTLFYYFRRDNVEHSFAPLSTTTKW